MNITLSADEDTIRLSREYARRHGTSLTRLVRDCLDRVTAADEFSRLALEHGGRSPKAFRFVREEAHRRA